MTIKRKKETSHSAGLTQGPLPLLYIPRAILRDTTTYFLPYCRPGVETACFWFGIETGTCQVVTTLVIPRLLQTAGNYQIDTTISRRLANEMSEQGLVNLAQVHTHPFGCSVSHSFYDDQQAYSTREGALSFVWPDYGCTASYNLTGVGIHERRRGHWVRLTEAQVTERICLIDSIADYRWELRSGGIEKNNDTTEDF
jgi:hypothetical protein